jgi:hypothetical protein
MDYKKADRKRIKSLGNQGKMAKKILAELPENSAVPSGLSSLSFYLSPCKGVGVSMALCEQERLAYYLEHYCLI